MTKIALFSIGVTLLVVGGVVALIWHDLINVGVKIISSSKDDSKP